MDDCPCGSGSSYAACCGPCHDGTRPALTAEALMRSRYAAFARGDGAYILATQAPGLSSESPEAVSTWARQRRWLGLRIVRSERGGPGDARGLVEFEAQYREGEQTATLREVSRFDRVNGRWRYLEGRVVRSAPKD